MSAVSSAGRHKPPSRQRPVSGRLAAQSALFGLGLLIAGESAFAQMMERLNKQANTAQAQAQAAAAAAAPAVPNPNCTLIVPANPLSAKGLATPYKLRATDAGQGPCNEFNTAQSAFVQAAVIDPATGQVSVYNPLVIDKGTTPAVAPIVPTLPAGGIVALWFGFNGTNLTLKFTNPADQANANCVNGSANGGVFGQYAYCNAPSFFNVANAAVANGQLKIPALGTAKDGGPCPSVRAFFVIDQDQSDNLPVKYLVTPAGKIAQFNQANIANLKGATTLSNPSDNGLVDAFMDPALGCTPAMAPNLTDPGQMTPAYPLNELSARVGQATPVALVPSGDPMVLLNGATEDLNKTNLYRVGADQPKAVSFENTSTARYCRQFLRSTPSRIYAPTTQALLANFTSPAPTAANSLFTFLAQRFSASYMILNCAALTGQADPTTQTMDGNGVVISAKLNTNMYNAELAALAGFVTADNTADSAANSRLAVEAAGPSSMCGGTNALPGAAPAYNVFIVGKGNFTSANTQTNGNIAVGGNATISNYAIASHINGVTTATPNPARLVVGGTATLANGGVGQNQSGAIYFGTTQPVNDDFTARGGTIQSNLIDFAGSQTTYQNLAASLGALAPTGALVVANEGGELTFTGMSTMLNIFTVTGAQLAQANEINITAPAGSAVVINVTGDAKFQNGAVNETGVSAANVLWNFPAASSVTLVGSMNPMGTILAPFSQVTGGFGESTGQLIAAGYNGNTSFENVPFACTLTTTAQ